MSYKIFKITHISEIMPFRHEYLRLRWKLTSGQERLSFVSARSRVTLDPVYPSVRPSCLTQLCEVLASEPASSVGQLCPKGRNTYTRVGASAISQLDRLQVGSGQAVVLQQIVVQ